MTTAKGGRPTKAQVRARNKTPRGAAPPSHVVPDEMVDVDTIQDSIDEEGTPKQPAQKKTPSPKQVNKTVTREVSGAIATGLHDASVKVSGKEKALTPDEAQSIVEPPMRMVGRRLPKALSNFLSQFSIAMNLSPDDVADISEVAATIGMYASRRMLMWVGEKFIPKGNKQVEMVQLPNGMVVPKRYLDEQREYDAVVNGTPAPAAPAAPGGENKVMPPPRWEDLQEQEGIQTHASHTNGHSQVLEPEMVGVSLSHFLPGDMGFEVG